MKWRDVSVLGVGGALMGMSDTSGARPLSSRPAQADLLDRAVAAWAKVKTVRATFEQTITNSLTGRTMTTTGEYQMERPGRLPVTFADRPTNPTLPAATSVCLSL